MIQGITDHANASGIQELERELRQKEKVLAETAAFLVLKKNAGDLEGRGRYHGPDKRTLMRTLITDAVAAGAYQN